jgi:triosephosphate isomerase
MNKTIAETIEFVNSVNEKALDVAKEDLIVGVAPSFICLPVLRKLGTGIITFAQNVHFEDNGAFTGEISPLMLEEIGVNACLVGHSERRQYFGETNETCNKKLKALEKHGFNALYCVGETLSEYEKGITKTVIKKQVLEGIEGLSKEYISNLTIAYEPVWSIGTGKNANKEIASDICGYITRVINDKYGEDVGDSVYVLYGGSVKPNNVKEYVDDENIDGALVCGASLKADSFIEMIDNLLE